MTINAFGDSITVGTGTGAVTWYAQLIGTMLNTTVNNYGINGAQIADMIPGIYANPINDTLMLTGFNDMRYYGMTNVPQYKASLYSAAVWIASGNKVLGQSGSVSYTGTWNNIAVYGGAIGKYSQAIGNTATFSITGSVIYISSIMLATSAGGTFSVTVDGTVIGTYSCSGMVNTNSMISYAPFLIRIPGLTNTSHTVVITQLTAGVIYFDFAATPVSGHTVVLSSCLTCTAYNYTLGAPPPLFTLGSDAAAALYTTANQDVATTLAADGLDVRFSNMVYNPNTESTVGNVHPTTVGQCAISLCFLNIYQPGWGA